MHSYNTNNFSAMICSNEAIAIQDIFYYTVIRYVLEWDQQ